MQVSRLLSRILTQLRADRRTVGLIAIVPAALLTLLYFVYRDYPGADLLFNHIAVSRMAILPTTVMFLVTSVAMLRERVSGTLERLWTTPIHRADLLFGYATAFALTAVIQEAWINGVSTRKVDELVQAMGMTGISKSSVSKLCKDIDERVNAFLKRPLAGEWPYLWLDATYLKVREGGRIVSVAAIIAVAVTTEGKREIVGLHIGPSEAEPFWSTFLRDLVRRGLKGVKLVISDAHEGLKAAITRVVGATWQRCRVHFMRNALAHVPKGQNTMVAAAIRQVFLQPDHAAATQTWRHVADQLRARWPKLGACMDNAEHDVLAYMTFPEQHRTKLHSTNPLERLNKEVKRRADVVGIFPNEDSITRLIGAVLLEQNDEYQLQNRYMQIEGMTALATPQIEEVPPLQITPKAA
ncbi:IS256 family transposase [uncultured Bradyrhizobium sp.]|uniref:IS256 family transposase n=1 Tax=uncultured Bradyrhizobium sp. TaxID=199684 RepID=UPI00261BCC3C|nr:IS256 family transposase [uncultured Bradyrhizobium sp.]